MVKFGSKTIDFRFDYVSFTSSFFSLSCFSPSSFLYILSIFCLSFTSFATSASLFSPSASSSSGLRPVSPASRIRFLFSSNFPLSFPLFLPFFFFPPIHLSSHSPYSSFSPNYFPLSYPLFLLPSLISSNFSPFLSFPLPSYFPLSLSSHSPYSSPLPPSPLGSRSCIRIQSR